MFSLLIKEAAGFIPGSLFCINVLPHTNPEEYYPTEMRGRQQMVIDSLRRFPFRGSCSG
jgi:hypothetical protein